MPRKRREADLFFCSEPPSKRAKQELSAFKLAAALRPWDTGELDDYELENIDSIRARALADALNGNPPNPIWGHDEPDTRDHG